MPTTGSVAIQVVKTTDRKAHTLIAQIRRKLSPSGDVVTAAGRKKTVAVFGEPLSPRQVVERICRDVRDKGWKAVAAYTEKLDGIRLTPSTVRVPEEALREAHRRVERSFLATVRRVRRNIERFHSGLLSRSARLSYADRFVLELRWTPIRRVGVCVPGGAAAYPSTILMTVVPAQVAGVSEIAVVSPPTANGADNDYVRATCYELGVRELYRCGGAQAVAALAYGVDGIPPVDKIVGPGNLFVTLAKREVFGTVGIDMLAGPTEVVVLADRTAKAALVASELIAQAEHAPGCSILITWSEPLVGRVLRELDRQLAGLERAELARESLEEFGAVVIARDRDEAVALANEIAPEHLAILTREPRSLLEQIRNAGAVFLGPYSPVALGDYAAGPSHVLPTGSSARYASCLTALDFLKRTSVIEYSPAGLADVAPLIYELAEVEGLTAHAASVRIRVGNGQGGAKPATDRTAAAGQKPTEA